MWYFWGSASAALSHVVLGIESSCDETAAAVFGADGLRSNVVASQLDAHQVFGGVVPELASRMHVEAISVVVRQALHEAGTTPESLDAVAVTHGPGLAGSLVVGVCAAKGLCLAAGLPLLGINHLEGHLYSLFIEPPHPALPCLALIASGGHSDLILFRDHGRYDVLGRARDDAAGEAFDKVARVLGLEYPGGPRLDQLAESGDATAFDLPRAWLDGEPAFSFSGLKTAVARLCEQLGPDGVQDRLADLCASFRQAVVDVLVRKTIAAAEAHGARQIAVCGGVAASVGLRRELAQAAAEAGLELAVPAFRYCTDNAAMIACAGHYRRQHGGPDSLALTVDSGLPLPAAGRWRGEVG